MRGSGQRTKLLAKREASPTTIIKYVDFASLYPDINKNGVYPVGHPITFTENTFPDARRILNYYTVLPFEHNKLTFAMWGTCARDGQKTCVSLELDLAIKKGCKVVKIHEVWHFQDRTNQLFRGPNNYAYKTHQGKTYYKVRGITLNFRTSLKVNFESIVEKQ